MKRNNRGTAILLAVGSLAILTMLGGGWLRTAAFSMQSNRNYVDHIRTLYLAEAGVEETIYQLRQDFAGYGGTGGFVDFSSGQYSATVVGAGAQRTIVTQGQTTLPNDDIMTRELTVVVQSQIPANLFDHAIYAADELDLNGNAYDVIGDVIWANELDMEHNLVTGTVTNDPGINPLADLNYQQLRDMAEAQGNVYDEERLEDDDPFPGDFWFTAPDPPEDPTTGVPNIVYVEGDLTLNGNIGTIGGFFVVVGDVITNSGAEEDVTINGNGQIDGVIYTRGDFRINGGGGGLNVFGGVIAGQEARLNGNANVTYNEDYMDALRALDLGAGVTVVSWQETDP